MTTQSTYKDVVFLGVNPEGRPIPPMTTAGGSPVSESFPKNGAGFSMIGDSRTADLTLGVGTNSRNWFNWACAYYKQAPRLVGRYGVSGKRTDEFLTNGNFELAVFDSAQFLIFGYPAVNDITQALAGYTDFWGRDITLANVAATAVDNVIMYAKKAISYGKAVIILTEPGSTSFTAAQTAQCHEFNRLLKSRAQEVAGAILYDPCPLLWNPTASTTQIAFRTNYSGDGTHAQQMAGRAVGIDFATNVLPVLLPKVDTAPANTSDNAANGTLQLFRNPLFNVLTGGTTGGNITLSSGTVPANITISGSAAAGLATTITSAANANGFGNDVTFAFTSTGAVNARIDLAANLADWLLTDTFEGRIEVDIAPGATNTNGVHAATNLQTDAGTNAMYSMYAAGDGPTSGPMITTGDTGLTHRTLRGGVPANSTAKSSVNLRILVAFSGAGACTITLRRPGLIRYPQ